MRRRGRTFAVSGIALALLMSCSRTRVETDVLPRGEVDGVAALLLSALEPREVCGQSYCASVFLRREVRVANDIGPQPASAPAIGYISDYVASINQPRLELSLVEHLGVRLTGQTFVAFSVLNRRLPTGEITLSVEIAPAHDRMHVYVIAHVRRDAGRWTITYLQYVPE